MSELEPFVFARGPLPAAERTKKDPRPKEKKMLICKKSPYDTYTHISSFFLSSFDVFRAYKNYV